MSLHKSKIFVINRKLLMFMSLFSLFICFGLCIYYNNYYQNELKEQEYIENLKLSFDNEGQKDYNKKDLDSGLNNKSYKDKNLLNNNYNNFNSKDNNLLENDNYEKDCDCIIEIPDINLSKIIYNGDEREKHLANYELITATPDMNYKSGGNYIICGHASKLYGHSLNRIKEVHKGTIIRIWANKSVDEYIVNKVYYEDMDKTSDFCRQTSDDQLTIISCAKYISYNSYIIVKAYKIIK